MTSESPVWADTWQLQITYVGDPAVYTRYVVAEVADDMATVLDSARVTIEAMGYRWAQVESVSLRRV